MSQRIFRSYHEPKRKNLTWNQRWKGEDKGLITCWEIGRELKINKPKLAEKILKDELPSLAWKGGLEKKVQKTEKYGTLHYLAQWQGLRGEDLNIDLSQEIEKICSRTGIKVIFTFDPEKYINS